MAPINVGPVDCPKPSDEQVAGERAAQLAQLRDLVVRLMQGMAAHVPATQVRPASGSWGKRHDA